jgi:D-galactose 1-dehydrogenase
MAFDWRQEGKQIWTIEAVTKAGTLTLENGGADMSIDNVTFAGDNAALAGEYPRLYANMSRIVEQGSIDIDLSPMTHVADAFTLGERLTVEPFDWQLEETR